MFWIGSSRVQDLPLLRLIFSRALLSWTPSEMPVVIVVAIVVSKNATIVDATESRINICQTVLNDSAALIPDFFFEYGPPPPAGQM